MADLSLAGWLGLMSISGHFVEMTSYELSLCVEIGQIRYCKAQVFNKPTTKTCLSSLFNADHASSISLCTLSLESAQEDQILQRAANEFTYFSKSKSASYSTRCPNNNAVSQLTQFTDLQVPPKCYVDTPSFQIFRQDALSIETDPPPSTYEWSLPPLEWLAEDTDIQTLDQAVKKLESMQIPDITSGSVQHLQHFQRPLIRNTPLVSSMVISSLALFIILGLILAICIQQRRHRLAARKLHDPVVRYQQVLKNSENVEALLQLIQDQKDQRVQGSQEVSGT